MTIKFFRNKTIHAPHREIFNEFFSYLQCFFVINKKNVMHITTKSRSL